MGMCFTYSKILVQKYYDQVNRICGVCLMLLLSLRMFCFCAINSVNVRINRKSSDYNNYASMKRMYTGSIDYDHRRDDILTAVSEGSEQTFVQLYKLLKQKQDNQNKVHSTSLSFRSYYIHVSQQRTIYYLIRVPLFARAYT